MTRQEIEDAIATAEHDPKAFFGTDSDAVLKKWQTITHPDKWRDDTELAKSWFVRFNELATESKLDKTIGEYRIVRTLPPGDICNIFIGDLNGQKALIKQPRVKAASLMKAEMANLNKMIGKMKEAATHLFPKPIGSVEGCNVFQYANDLTTVAQLKTRYPDGVGGRHIGWLTKRILLALSWAHGEGVVHGAVTDEHVLVCKRNHGIVLCDWTLSGKPGDAIKVVPKKYKDYYATAKDKKLSKALDIAMTGHVLSSLIGDAPKKLRAFIHAMKVGNIGTDHAWTLHQEWDDLLRSGYGAPKWVELV